MVPISHQLCAKLGLVGLLGQSNVTILFWKRRFEIINTNKL